METFTRLLIATLTCIVAKTQAEPPKSIPKRADISVSGIFLEDPASTEKVLGKEISHEEQLAYWNKDRIAKNDALRAFVDLYMSDAGLSEGVQQAGYVDIPADRMAKSRSTWRSAEGAS